MDTRQEISDLTCCRGLFAAWVFIYHVNLHAQFSLGPAARLIQRGYLGVDGFFVLSGLILARVHPELSRSTATARRFWGKRLARVYPVHLAIIVLLSVLLLAGLSAGIAPQDPTRFTLGSLIENLLLIQGWGLGDGWSWNYPSWSVSTEWAGYLLFPFLWFGLGLCNAVVLGQIAIICFPVLGLVAFVSGHGLNVSLVDALPRFLPEFIWGMCTARLVPIFADSLPTAAFTIAGFFVALAAVLCGLDTLSVAGLWLALASVTMHADAERPPLFRKLPLLRSFGLLSYSFYMSFGTSELIIGQIFRHQNWNPAENKLVYSVAMTLLTFCIAMFMHVLVERPCRRMADRWLAEPDPLAGRGVRM